MTESVPLPFVVNGGLDFIKRTATNCEPALIVAGTGSGKTTTLGEFYADLYADHPPLAPDDLPPVILIVPNRSSASSMYKHLTRKRPTIASRFGYRIGGNESVFDRNCVVLCVTAGWFLTTLMNPAIAQRRPTWRVLILDEAHTVSSDYYLVRKITKHLLYRKHHEFKLFICSATITSAMFSDDFPTITATNTLIVDDDPHNAHRVTVDFQPTDLLVTDRDKADPINLIVATVCELQREEPFGDKLVFCDGEETVCAVAERLAMSGICVGQIPDSDLDTDSGSYNAAETIYPNAAIMNKHVRCKELAATIAAIEVASADAIREYDRMRRHMCCIRAQLTNLHLNHLRRYRNDETDPDMILNFNIPPPTVPETDATVRTLCRDQDTLHRCIDTAETTDPLRTLFAHRRTYTHLCKELASDVRQCVRIVTLYAKMGRDRIDRILQRRFRGTVIYVCTNIVESSVTLPTVVHGVCTGIHKIAYTDALGRTEFRRERCSQNNLRQQIGRCNRNPCRLSDGRIIPGRVIVMMTHESWSELPQAPMRDIYTGPLFKPLLTLINLGYQPDLIADDLAPQRITDDLTYLRDHHLIRISDTPVTSASPTTYSITDIGRTIRYFSINIPQALHLYSALTHLRQTAASDADASAYIWPLLFITACSVINPHSTPFRYPSQPANTPPQQWNTTRTNFAATNFYPYYGCDDVDTMLTVYRRCVQHRTDNGDHPYALRSFMTANHLNERFIRDIDDTLTKLISDVQRIGIDTASVCDTGMPYTRAMQMIWPIIEHRMPLYRAHAGSVPGRPSYYRTHTTTTDRHCAQIHYTLDRSVCYRSDQFTPLTELIALHCKCVTPTNKPAFYTLNMVIRKPATVTV